MLARWPGMPASLLLVGREGVIVWVLALVLVTLGFAALASVSGYHPPPPPPPPSPPSRPERFILLRTLYSRPHGSILASCSPSSSLSSEAVWLRIPCRTSVPRISESWSASECSSCLLRTASFISRSSSSNRRMCSDNAAIGLTLLPPAATHDPPRHTLPQPVRAVSISSMAWSVEDVERCRAESGPEPGGDKVAARDGVAEKWARRWERRRRRRSSLRRVRSRFSRRLCSASTAGITRASPQRR